MKLSRESEYGIQGLIHLAKQPPGTVLQLAAIAEAQGLPQSFLAKIFQKLTQYEIVRSFRGATRGYTLGRPPGEITLREVLESIEGPGLFERCIFWSHRCAEDNPCVLHEGWKLIKPKLTAMMEVTTLQDLVRRAATARKHKRGR
ncbi:MAG: Rrf2 family transcriptional regulator [candidate division NC10 bacterium]|nr:Rrf2 family transcriptional regulator [candidate division NC10 bacterium]